MQDGHGILNATKYCGPITEGSMSFGIASSLAAAFWDGVLISYFVTVPSKPDINSVPRAVLFVAGLYAQLLTQTPRRIQKVEPRFSGLQNSHGGDHRALRWIYFMDRLNKSGK